MAFEKQVFISYAHIDNEPLSEKQLGWITRFHAISLGDAEHANRPQGGDLARQPSSPATTSSPTKSLQQFPKRPSSSQSSPRVMLSRNGAPAKCRSSARRRNSPGGVIVDNKSRVLKVIKIPGGDREPSARGDEAGAGLSLLRLR